MLRGRRRCGVYALCVGFSSSTYEAQGKALSGFQRSWSRTILDCTQVFLCDALRVSTLTTDADNRQPHALARVLGKLPEDALRDAAIWGTVINVFKRHRTLGGVTWALNEIRERKVSFRDHGCVVTANALSAFGFLDVPQRAVELLCNERELRECTGVQKGTLLSIAAVALARCGVDCSELVGDALQELEHADPLSAEVELAWGRCMRAYQLLGNLEAMRGLLMEHDWVFRRKGQDLRSAEDRALFIHSARLANCMIRAYGDVGDIEKAKEIYAIAKAGRHSTLDGDVDMTRAHFLATGLGPTLEWLCKNVDPRSRSEAYTWLMEELLSSGRASEAQVLYHIVTTGDVDTQAFIEGHTVTEAQMRDRVRLQSRRAHRLYARQGERGIQQQQHRVIEWTELLCQVKDTALFERLMRHGTEPIPTRRVGAVLGKCVQLSSAVGVALLVEHNSRPTGSGFEFWSPPFGNFAMQSLYDILLKPHVSDHQRASVRRVAADLYARYPVRSGAFGTLESVLYEQLLLGIPSASTVLERMRHTLPKSAAFWKDYMGKREQFLAVRLVIDMGAVDEWKEQVLSSVRRLRSEHQYALCMVDLVPKYCSLQETVGRAAPAFQLAYYQRAALVAQTVGELRQCFAQIPPQFMLPEVCAALVTAFARFPDSCVDEIRNLVDLLCKQSSPSVNLSRVLETLHGLGMVPEMKRLLESIPPPLLQGHDRIAALQWRQRLSESVTVRHT